MSKNIYFDTNVIIDLFDNARPYHHYSLEVFNKIFSDEDMNVFINTDTMSKLFYILRSRIKLSFTQSIKNMEFIRDSFTIIYSEEKEINNTLEICKKDLFDDYEDAMQYICALKSKSTILITNNPKDFKNSTIDIITTKELSEFWRKQD